MKRILMSCVIFTLCTPAFAAKWNQVTGDDLKALYSNSVLMGEYKGTKYTIHNCADGLHSTMKFGKDPIKERVITYPEPDVMCNEDAKSNRCYNIFQHAKKPTKYKFKGIDSSSSGKFTLLDESPDRCS